MAQQARIQHCHCCGLLTAVAQAQELPHPIGMAKKKKKDSGFKPTLTKSIRVHTKLKTKYKCADVYRKRGDALTWALSSFHQQK